MKQGIPRRRDQGESVISGKLNVAAEEETARTPDNSDMPEDPGLTQQGAEDKKTSGGASAADAGDAEAGMPRPESEAETPPADTRIKQELIRILPIADKTVYAGEEDVVPVRVEREGYNGPFELNLEGLPSGTQQPVAVVPSGQSRALVEFKLPTDTKAATTEVRVVASFEDLKAEKTFRMNVRKRPPPQPLVMPIEGLGRQKSLKPITFGPDWLGFNQALSPEAWQAPGVFARLQTKAALGYPSIPASTYVLEMELEILHPAAGLRICLGDPWSAIQLSIYRNENRNKIEAIIPSWRYGGWNWSGHRDFELGERLPLKWIVLDGRHTVCLRNKPILLEDNAWPADLTLRIWCETPAAAAIHRCSCRALHEEDVQLLDVPMPLSMLALDPAAAKARIETLRDRQPSRPAKGKGYLAGKMCTPMVWIPPGEYVHASHDLEASDKRRVKITQGFWMGQLEVTQEEWNSLMPDNPSRVQGSPYLPVDWVTWEGAAKFCGKLHQREAKSRRLPKGYEYRLPTDAEWEYACRAGSEDDFSVPQADIWSREYSEDGPHEVGQKPANAWGLFDMHGNAMEWCLDAWYECPKDPTAVLVDPYKPGRVDQDPFVVRGGAWFKIAKSCQSGWRDRNHSTPAAGYRGFRIVLGPSLTPTMN